MTLAELQRHIEQLYGDKDRQRGIEGTFMWLIEEVGELSSALRSGNAEELKLEFADVLAWVATLANCANVNLEEAMRAKYGQGCPGCGTLPCRCALSEKP